MKHEGAPGNHEQPSQDQEPVPPDTGSLDGVFFTDTIPADIAGPTSVPDLKPTLLPRRGAAMPDTPTVWHDPGEPLYTDEGVDAGSWAHPEAAHDYFSGALPIQEPFGQETFSDSPEVADDTHLGQDPRTGEYAPASPPPWDWSARVAPDENLPLGTYEELASDQARGEGPFAPESHTNQPHDQEATLDSRPTPPNNARDSQPPGARA